MTIKSSAIRAAALVGLLGLVPIGCGKADSPATDGESPAAVTSITGSEVKRVTLTLDAEERIGLTLTPVTTKTELSSVPYGALLYDPSGKTWIFVQVANHAFERRSVDVSSIVGDVVSLRSGPRPGTLVVSVGATELYGAEIGVGDE